MSLAKPLCAQLSNESLPSLEEGRRAPSVNRSIKSAIPPPSPPQPPVPFSPSTSETRSPGTYPIIMMMVMNVLAAIKKSGANAIKQIVILLV